MFFFYLNFEIVINEKNTTHYFNSYYIHAIKQNN